MKKIQVWIAIMFLSGIFVIVGCSKEGPAGPAGPAGQNGTQGSAGQDGNANVISSGPLSINWLEDTVDFYWYANIAAPQLTDSNVNVASVCAYLGIFDAISNSYEWILLPYSYGGISIFTSFYVGNFYLESSDFYPDDPNTYDLKFRYVIIPPAAKAANPAINLKDWNSVKKAFRLQD